jgi:hypothetical protein
MFDLQRCEGTHLGTKTVTASEGAASPIYRQADRRLATTEADGRQLN